MSEAIRVLIADDHPLFREGITSSLGQDANIAVVAQATSGEQALEFAFNLQPDVVLLDVSMPGMGGIDAAEKIAANLPATRIIMLTVEENDDVLLSALKAGAHGYVLKGVSASELRTIVKRIADGEAYITPRLASKMLLEFSRPRQPDIFTELTIRELEILDLLSEGLGNKAIADRLHLAEKTVKHHMTKILQKLQVHSRTEAALLASRRKVR